MFLTYIYSFPLVNIPNDFTTLNVMENIVLRILAYLLLYISYIFFSSFKKLRLGMYYKT